MVRYQRKPSVFCLQSGSTQYGVLSVEITPEEVDMVYLISIQMANGADGVSHRKKAFGLFSASASFCLRSFEAKMKF